MDFLNDAWTSRVQNKILGPNSAKQHQTRPNHTKKLVDGIVNGAPSVAQTEVFAVHRYGYCVLVHGFLNDHRSGNGGVQKRSWENMGTERNVKGAD